MNKIETDIIGGFPYASPECKGCGEPLTLANAWMTDGCPCNSELGVNSMNETRWRLLMERQQRDRSYYEYECKKYQQETLRSSDFAKCLRWLIEAIEHQHSPGPWSKNCSLCKLVGEAKELLSIPINKPWQPKELAPAAE